MSHQTRALLSSSYPVLHPLRFGEVAAGTRTSLLDAEGFTTTFAYDDLGRLVGIDYPAPEADVPCTYDGAGDRVSMTDGIGGTSWLYDDLHRPTSVTDPFSGVVGYGYDAAGNRRSLAYPDSRSVDFEYDDASRLQTVTDWDSLLTTYAFDKAGRLGTVSLPNDIESRYVYDSASHLVTLTHAEGSDLLALYNYTYDDVGNRLTQTTHLGSDSCVYDIANRLTSVDGVNYPYAEDSGLLPAP